MKNRIVLFLFTTMLFQTAFVFSQRKVNGYSGCKCYNYSLNNSKTGDLGNKTITAEYTYNNKGYAVDEIMYEEGVVASKLTYKYYPNDSVSEEIHDTAFVSISKVIYEYDLRGNLISQNAFDKKGENVGSTSITLKYDGLGRIQQKTESSYISGLSQYSYTYAANGKVKYVTIGGNIGGIIRITNVFDSQARVILREERFCSDFDEYPSGGSVTKEYFKYDKNGHVIEKAHYSYDGSFSWKMIYKYDEKGNLLMIESFKPDASGNNVLSGKTEYEYY